MLFENRLQRYTFPITLKTDCTPFNAYFSNRYADLTIINLFVIRLRHVCYLIAVTEALTTVTAHKNAAYLS